MEWSLLPGTKTKYCILTWDLKIFLALNGSKNERLSSPSISDPPPTKKQKKSHNSVKDHFIHNKDRGMRMNVMEYHKTLKLPTIKMIFKWRWIQTVPWLYFLILLILWFSPLTDAIVNKLPTLPHFSASQLSGYW